MVTLYKIKKNMLVNNKSYILCDLVGLSSDEKPTSYKENIISNGSAFIEMDTQDIYFYDQENETWLNPNADEQQEGE